MQTIVELPEFIRRARPLLSEREVQSLVSYLALMPLAGDLMEEPVASASFGGLV